ncbi:MAG: type IV pilus twitching motility protein PilT [Thermoleophilia bacterium]|nr:type IV pilus twitching motility protein PilT [Thermoleophilia bacterium]
MDGATASASAEGEVRDSYSIDELLEIVVERNASDLHITTGTQPVIRVNGRLDRLDGFASLRPEQTQQLLYGITATEQQKELEQRRQIDLSYSLPGLARFRVNIYFQRASLAGAFRLVPSTIKPLEELGLPATLYELAARPRGLVVVTGPTGSGKSTTLASMIDRINETRTDHIVTIEDPIEFLHRHKRCVVNQREIGPDATSFSEALRGALRQDPDVILLGEMRDLETIATALTAAETGHLVFATVHTQDAPSAVDRIIDVFPAAQQGQIRVQVAATLQGVVTQNLLPTADGRARVPACEILIPDDAIRNLIRQGKIEQVYSVMQTGSQKGMQTMEQSLVDLVIRGYVTQEMALSRSSRPAQLLELIQRGRGGGTTVSPLQARLRTAGS